MKGKGREQEGREEKGMQGKGREGKGREGKVRYTVREGKGRKGIEENQGYHCITRKLYFVFSSINKRINTIVNPTGFSKCGLPISHLQNYKFYYK